MGGCPHQVDQPRPDAYIHDWNREPGGKLAERHVSRGVVEPVTHQVEEGEQTHQAGEGKPYHE
jgi:hypothetical protein